MGAKRPVWRHWLKRMIAEVRAARMWLAIYTMLLFIPLSLLLYMHSERSSAVVEEQVTRSMLKTVQQAALNMEYQFNRVSEVSDALLMNPVVYEALRPPGEGGFSYLQQYEEKNKLLTQVIVPAEANPNVFRVRLFLKNYKIYTGEKINFFSLSDAEDQSWYKSVEAGAGRNVWIGSRLERFIDREGQIIFSVGRMLRDPEHYEEWAGLLLIDMRVASIWTVIRNLSMESSQQVSMTDKNGLLMYQDNSAPSAALPRHLTEEWKSQTEGILRWDEGRETRYAVFTEIGGPDWMLSAQIPAAEISRQAVLLGRYSELATLMGAVLMLVLLVLVLQTYFVRRINSRMKTAVRAIRQSGGEPLNADYLNEPDSLLERSVDQLIRKVQLLMEEVYSAQVREREARLQALQAQINPHFLYNTLDTINWLARDRQAPDISRMIEGLSSYFRLSLSKGEDLVKVSDELELAKVYLELQHERFDGMFEFFFEADSGVGNYSMPKLTLQPLVENALLHGIRKKKTMQGTIRVTVSQEADMIVIQVRDDGVGFDKRERFMDLRKNGMLSGGARDSYALSNVEDRLALFNGSSGGLDIHSVPGEGTVVTIRLIKVASKI